ncbi:MAG: hypothetical protein HP494_03155 [Nitrospira sp.]|nr:hypothetical protein [Nitrospira sp.]MBH0194601.1 hypothetical protein [Nitrospira sp.]
MNCSRCQGLMVPDNLIDMRESYLPMWMRGLRCVACGNVVDPLIAHNRMRQQLNTEETLKPGVHMPALHPHAKAA